MSYVTWLRGRVGHRKIFLPYVTVIVRDEHGRVLLQERSDFAFYGLPGGVLELDEDVETGARREVLEETGLTLGPLRLVGAYTDPRYDVRYPNGDLVQQFTFCLEGQCTGGEMRADGVETIAQRLVDPADLPAYDLPLWYRDMLRDALENDLPAFQAPFALPHTTDQIRPLRALVGRSLISGVGATAVILDERGRILLLQHQDQTGWRLPAGFSELGENAAQTMVREVWEETRLEVVPERLVGVYANPALNAQYPNGDRIRNVGVAFRAGVPRGLLRLERSEVRDLAWVERAELLDRVAVARRPFYQLILNCLDKGYFVY